MPTIVVSMPFVFYASEEYPSMMPFLRVLLFCFLYFQVYFVRNGKLLSTHWTNAKTAVTIVTVRADIARIEAEAARVVAVTRTERTRPVLADATRIAETAASRGTHSEPQARKLQVHIFHGLWLETGCKGTQ